MRWKEEAEQAMRRRGYEVVDQDGVDDYQGWGVLLGRANSVWAVLAWSYGSCSYCDGYEDMSDEERVLALEGEIEDGMDEQTARALFDARKWW